MESLKTQVRRRWEDLKAERSTWMPHWREISEVLLPRSGGSCPPETTRAIGMPIERYWIIPAPEL